MSNYNDIHKHHYSHMATLSVFSDRTLSTQEKIVLIKKSTPCIDRVIIGHHRGQNRFVVTVNYKAGGNIHSSRIELIDATTELQWSNGICEAGDGNPNIRAQGISALEPV